MKVVLKGGRSITLPALFDMPESPGEAVASAVRVPAGVRLEPNALELTLFDAALRLELERLATHENFALGDGWLSVSSTEDGERVLAGLGEAVDRDVPESEGERGPLGRLPVNVAGYRTSSGVRLEMTVEGLPLSLELAGPGESDAVLVIDDSALDSHWESFSWQWLLAFVEGQEPRLTQVEEPLMSSDEPWIKSVTALEGADDLDLSEAVFGGNTLFATTSEPADDDEEPPLTRVLAWQAVGDQPKILVEERADEHSISPSPDGRWVVVQLGRTGEGDRLLLVHVADGSVRELTSDQAPQIFGSAIWSDNAQRFAIGCASLDQETPRSVLVFDIEGATVAACQHESLPSVWVDSTLWLTLTKFAAGGRVSEHFSWTPGGGEPEPGSEPPRRSPDGRFTIGDREDGFVIDWRGAFLVDEERDARALDLATGRWRYLAARSAGAAIAISSTGSRALFQRAGRHAIGGC